VLVMEITDDGRGGVTADAAHRAGHHGASHHSASHHGASHGLANISDRVSALDGELAIDSPPGGGTRLVVSIPCA